MTAEISSIFKTVLPLCPSCRAEISEDDSFCQECGSALSLPDAVESVSQPAQLKMARLHPSRAKPVVTLPLVALAVVGFALIMVFLVGFEKSYSGFSNRYVIEQATKSYKENRYDEAATILERFSVGHKLDESERTLLSDVYLARAEQRVTRADYVGAMSDLGKIPSQYSKFILVTGRKNELAELIKVQQAQAQSQSTSATKGHSKQERSKSSTSPVSSLTSPVSSSTSPVLSSTKSISSTTKPSSSTTNSVLQAPLAISTARQAELPRSSARSDSPVVHSELPAAHSEALVRSAESQPAPVASPPKSDLAAQKVLLKAKAAKITESDQVRYNELLAGYFSQDHKQTSGASEPPSLKEWIDIGRPKF